MWHSSSKGTCDANFPVWPSLSLHCITFVQLTATVLWKAADDPTAQLPKTHVGEQKKPQVAAWLCCRHHHSLGSQTPGGCALFVFPP